VMPVDDRLVGNTVRVVQDLDQLGKRLHESSVGVAVDLCRVEQTDFGLGTFAECLEDGCSSLHVRAVYYHDWGPTVTS
jgi:hypothetical protein